MNTGDFALIIVSAMLHAGWNFFTKKSSADKVATLWCGWLVAGIFMLPVAIYLTDFSTFSIKWIPLLLLTGFIHAIYIYLLGSSYRVGEMSLIYPISRGIGIFGTISVVSLFGIESIQSNGMIGIMILVCGIMLVALKRLRDLERRAVMKLAAKVGVCISCYSVVDKLSVGVIPPIFYMTVMFIISPLILMPVMLKELRGEMMHVLHHYKAYSGAIGLVSFITYLMILIAMQGTPASYVVALREISIVFGSALGMWLLKEECNRRKILGVVCIMIGAYIIKAS